jgi:hypothetical protein
VPDFRASNGKFYTRQLFVEEWTNLMFSEREIKPPFSLYRDREGMINFGARYVELGDPSGYKISKELLGDYKLWLQLMKCKWFRAAKEIWDKELDAKLSSEGLDKLRHILETGLPAQQLVAAKYLANKEHRRVRGSTKGRPSKEAVDKAAREQAELDRELEDDAKRIRLVKG